jgi:hypothetical protein
VPHVIIRGNNGRRHEVDFEKAEITVEVFANNQNVELVNLPRSEFDKAMANLARKGSSTIKAVE